MALCYQDRVRGYGRRDGEGPTKGKKASVYAVTMPDGSVVRKSTFKLSQPEAVACIYQHNEKWYVSGLVNNIVNAYARQTAPAFRINQ